MSISRVEPELIGRLERQICRFGPPLALFLRRLCHHLELQREPHSGVPLTEREVIPDCAEPLSSRAVLSLRVSSRSLAMTVADLVAAQRLVGWAEHLKGGPTDG
jgi:hypothetical protein